MHESKSRGEKNLRKATAVVKGQYQIKAMHVL